MGYWYGTNPINALAWYAEQYPWINYVTGGISAAALRASERGSLHDPPAPPAPGTPARDLQDALDAWNPPTSAPRPFYDEYPPATPIYSGATPLYEPYHPVYSEPFTPGDPYKGSGTRTSDAPPWYYRPDKKTDRSGVPGQSGTVSGHPNKTLHYGGIRKKRGGYVVRTCGLVTKFGSAKRDFWVRAAPGKKKPKQRTHCV